MYESVPFWPQSRQAYVKTLRFYLNYFVSSVHIMGLDSGMEYYRVAPVLARIPSFNNRIVRADLIIARLDVVQRVSVK